MKAFTTICLLLFCLVGKAANLTNLATVTLVWDASPEDYRTNNAFYRVYAGTNFGVSTDLSLALTNAYAGTNLSVTLTNLAPGTWTFVATAFSGGLESVPSNPAVYTIRATPPGAPGRMATVFLDTTINMTDWTERGFFRARIGISP